MGREDAVRETEACLEGEGYVVSHGEGCFDLIARKRLSVAVKVLSNVDSFTLAEASDLLTLSGFIGTVPVVVGERANRYRLEESVMYRRHGIPAMSPDTFSEFARGAPPMVSARRGGYSAHADPGRIASAMRERGLSPAGLAAVAGLSLKTVYKCLKSGAVDAATLEAMEAALGCRIGADSGGRLQGPDAGPEPRTTLKRIVSGHLDRMGLRHSFLSRSPFNLVMEGGRVLVSVVSGDRTRLAASAEMLRDIGNSFGLTPFYITPTPGDGCVAGIPAVGLRELPSMGSRRELEDALDARRA